MKTIQTRLPSLSVATSTAMEAGRLPSPGPHRPRGRSQSGKAAPWILAVALLAAAAGGWWWWKGRDGMTGAGGSPAAGGARGPGAASGAGGPGGPGGPGGAAGNRRFAANRVQPVSVAQARLQDIRQTASAIGTSR